MVVRCGEGMIIRAFDCVRSVNYNKNKSYMVFTRLIVGHFEDKYWNDFHKEGYYELSKILRAENSNWHWISGNSLAYDFKRHRGWSTIWLRR